MGSSEGLQPGRVALVGLFVTALVTAQLTASKLLAFDLPVALPVTGGQLVLPGGVLAYAVTFFATDCYTELYGKRPAQVLVTVGFGAMFVLLGLVWFTILAPAGRGGVSAETFRTAFAPATNIVVGSLAAYVVSQNLDVFLFHGIRNLTGSGFLWLRNIASTGTSQAVDTVMFVGLAFYLLPRYAGIGPSVPLSVVYSLIVGQYLAKLAIALGDTPFVYLAVTAIRGREHGHESILFASER